MSNRVSNLPRRIDPSLVEIGDKISVIHKRDRGITMTLEGVVADRVDHGKTRRFVTSENATLFAFDVDSKPTVTVTLITRQAVPQATLFEVA